MISVVMEAAKDTTWPIAWAESKGRCEVRWGWYHNGDRRVRVGVQHISEALAMVHGPDLETLELLWLQTKGAKALFSVPAARKRPDWPMVRVASVEGELEQEYDAPLPAPMVSGGRAADALEEDPVKGKLESLTKDINKPLEVWNHG